jgi:hypothetical protein
VSVVAVARGAWQRSRTMFRRLLLGLLKGLLLGGAVGAALHFGAHLFTSQGLGWLNYMLYGLVAALAGIAAGKPPWREGAWVETLLKAIVGFGIGAGVFALAHYFLKVPIGGLLNIPAGTHLAEIPLFFAPIVATVYASLVELDNTGNGEQDESKTGVRVKASGESGRAAELEESSRSASSSERSARGKR